MTIVINKEAKALHYVVFVGGFFFSRSSHAATFKAFDFTTYLNTKHSAFMEILAVFALAYFMALD